ncbi:MAG: DNA mismatch repair protein MutS, partial [Saprospiraceae bacterium]
IHVARMAGMPAAIVTRATALLQQLESQHLGSTPDAETDVAAKRVDAQALSAEALQLSIFETSDPTAGRLKAALQEVNINGMTPIECMMKLKELRDMLEGG